MWFPRANIVIPDNLLPSSNQLSRLKSHIPLLFCLGRNIALHYCSLSSAPSRPSSRENKALSTAESFPAVPLSPPLSTFTPQRRSIDHIFTMQAVPEPRQQTFEEIYGPPENFLEIEVCGASIPSLPTLKHQPSCYYQNTTSTFLFFFFFFSPLLKSLFFYKIRFAILRPMAPPGTCTPHMKSSAERISPPSS